MKLHVLVSVLLFASQLFAVPPGQTPHFGKVVNGSVQYAPLRIPLGNIVDGVVYPNCIWTSHGATNQYAALGWLPVDRTPHERPGFIVEASGAWAVTNGVVAPVWTWRALPPRNLQLSKMKLKANMRQIGIWSNVWQMVSSDPDLLSDWNDSVVFDERNEFVQGAFSALEAAGLTPELREFIITNSITEIEVRQ